MNGRSMTRSPKILNGVQFIGLTWPGSVHFSQKLYVVGQKCTQFLRDLKSIETIHLASLFNTKISASTLSQPQVYPYLYHCLLSTVLNPLDLSKQVAGRSGSTCIVLLMAMPLAKKAFWRLWFFKLRTEFNKA